MKIKRLFILSLVLVLLGSGFTFSGWRRELARGNKAMESDRPDQAVENYNQALVEEPDNPLIHYNLGVAKYKQDNFEEAQQHFDRVVQQGEDGLKSKGEYNLGNTLYRQGEKLVKKNPKEAINKFNTALQHYQQVIKSSPEDIDAKFNYEFVKKKLEELEDQMKNNQQENQQQQNQNNNQDKKNKQDKEQNNDSKGNNNDQNQDQKGQQDQKEDSQNSDQKSEQNNPEEQKSKQQSEKNSEDGSANQQASPENGLTQEQALQLLEQFAKEEGNLIPVKPKKEDDGQSSDKNW